MSKLAALAERLAEGARRELKMAMDESRRGRAAALDAFLGRIRTDAVQWDALPDGDKARILRLAAARALAHNDRSSARRHADDAAAFHEPEDRALEALLLRSEERSEEALRLLADPVNEAERHTRAAILIEVGRSTEALSVLGTDDPVSAAPVDAEAVRLTVLAWVLERQPQTALDVSARARSSITLDDAGVAWAEAVAHFNAALANGVVPDLGAFPNPVDRSLFRQDAASLGHLDEAARRFSELAGSVDASERGDLEVWHLAAISSDPTRGEQAEMLSRRLLSRANPHPGAVAWALARGYEVNSDRIRRSYRDLVAADRGTASHLAVLAGLEVSLGRLDRAERLLEEEGGRFPGANDRALVRFWVEQIGRAKAGGQNRLPLPPELERLFGDALAGDEVAAGNLGERLTEAGTDGRIVAQLAEVLARAGRHAAVLKLAPQLLGFGTARGVTLVARAAFFIGDWRQTLDTLRDGAAVFVGGRLPHPLIRLQSEAALRLGDPGGALAYARAAVAVDRGDAAEAMRDLAVLHHQIGDVRGAASQLRRLGDVELLPAREAIVFARDIRGHDPDLARRLLQRAGRDLLDPGVVAEGMRLALDIRADDLARDVFGPAFRRLAAEPDEQAVIRVLDAESAAAAIHDAARTFEEAWRLWLDAAVPIHIAFGEIRPDVIATLFDGRRDLNQEAFAPLLVRPGRPDASLEDSSGISAWSLTLDLTALLLADALDLLDVVTQASAAILLPPSVPEALRILEDAVRPIQPHVRDAEAVVNAAVREGRIATVPDDDFGSRRVVRERNDPSAGPRFADLAATLRDRCGLPRDRIDGLLGNEHPPGDPRLLDPGMSVVVHASHLVQLETAGCLDSVSHHFGLAVRRAEADTLARAVANHGKARACAERIARLRERVADHLGRRAWSFVPQQVGPDGVDHCSAPERCLRELLTPRRDDGNDGRIPTAWVEDRVVSGFSATENRTAIVTVVEVLAALQRSGRLTDADFLLRCGTLRRLGYAFLPFQEEEVTTALAAAPVEDSRVVETEALTTIRRHLALQIEYLAHASVNAGLRRPDGRVDDSGIVAHLFGLWHRTLPKLWSRFPGDRRRRHAAAAWVLTNLRIETAVVGSLAERAPETLEHFRLQSCAWLIVQAAFIPVASVAGDAAGPARWEVWQDLVSDYVRFVLAAVIQPFAEAHEGNSKAIVRALAAWARQAAAPVPAMVEGVGEERARSAILAVLRLVLVQLPVEWLERLASEPGFTDTFGAFVTQRAEIGPFALPVERLWPAIERALADGEARLVLDEPNGEAVVRSRVADDGLPRIIVEPGEAELELRDPTVALAHPDEEVRRLTLDRDVDWLDGTPERRRQIAASIVRERDVIRRMAAFERVREASLVWRLRKIGACLRDQTAMDWSLLEPPSPDSVRDHLRLDPGRDGPSSVDAADVAVSRLLEELPVEFAAARLAGLVAPLPDTFMAALARWLEAEPEEIVGSFYSTPLRARLAARALVVHGAGRAGAVGRHLALLAEALEDGSALFCAVLRWVVRETARRGDWQPLTSEDRAALAWIYADLLAATLLAAEVDRAGTAQVFEERSELVPSDLLRRSKRSPSLAERGQRLSTRALAGVILGDVLVGLRPDEGPSSEERERLRALCASPDGPYAAPELLGLGRPGWSWLDADPLPILAQHLDAFGPENLTGLDRRRRVELVAGELAQNLGSDVAGLLLVLIGVDALDPSFAVDLLTRMRAEISCEVIAEQETLGSLRTEAALVDACGSEAGPTVARAKETAKLLGIRHRGAQLGVRTDDGADTPADRHIHSLLEVAWTLTDAADGRLAIFADLAASFVACWPEARVIVAPLMSTLTNVLPIATLMELQPQLERIRRL
ncbi:hypothetical protein [Methylobacterium aquaticum]|uniref:Uncharacterized protein n=1 Tax=Methylobacterium aquaticum TaxID=270351 RepID=A0A0J6SRH4_9HYPH|nr:hypothetical protein [Methylobacterium aquaticum]KMO36177.1 hypothetical protein VP06_10325 [Methylobacterium aquaticum]